MNDSLALRAQAEAIWRAGVAAVDPFELVRQALASSSLGDQLRQARQILVVGGGKAGTAMAAGVEAALSDCLDRLQGWINVPAGATFSMQKIHLHPARPSSSNHPTAEGVAGSEAILRILDQAGPEDQALVLLSGGGSALLPAPVPGVTLADKQKITRLLHESGASIDSMNCVRKHLSRIKGGRLAQHFLQGGGQLTSLIISDVVGDPLDVIASGPTAADPTTFADALAVLESHGLLASTPAAVRNHLEQGRDGRVAETLKESPQRVTNRIIGNNQLALQAAQRKAEDLGYRVLSLGSYLEGETREVAGALAGMVRSILHDGQPCSRPVCILSGGETTVNLGGNSGKGGRNQELALAMACRLQREAMKDWVLLLCAGSDGEDGPTDAAGAIVDSRTYRRSDQARLNPQDFLKRHDAYHFFSATNDLFKTGLTGTNVMDLNVFLVR